MRRSKYPVLWIFALLGLFAFFILPGEEESASEQTSSINREMAGRLAADFLHKEGVSVAELNRTVLYQGETEMTAYLQRQELTDQFAAKKDHGRPLTSWLVTFFQPGEDTYRVWIDDAAGKVLGYEFKLKHRPSGPSITSREAIRLAQDELFQHGVRFSRLELVDAGTVKSLPPTSRDDYIFRWKDTSWNVGQSSFYHEVKIAGKQVTSYRTYYEIPEADQQWFAKQETLGMILTWISLLGMLLLVIFSLVVAFAHPRHEVDWERGLVLALILLGIGLLSHLNDWPTFLTNMTIDFGMPLAVILWGTALFVSVMAVLSSGAVYIGAVAGSILQKDLWRDKWLHWGDGRWPERLRQAAFRGYLLAFVWLGLQSVFYWISETWLGVWTEDDYSMTPWNYLMPGLFPILAWTAGIGEEITFRLLGMGLVKKYLRSTFLALLIPSMIWALAHSLYPVHPFYTRFVELTLFGMLIGWFFLRYDLETVIFAHVVFDSVLMSLPLLMDGSWADRMWAVGWLILPAVIGRYAHLLQPRMIRQREFR